MGQAMQVLQLRLIEIVEHRWYKWHVNLESLLNSSQLSYIVVLVMRRNRLDKFVFLLGWNFELSNARGVGFCQVTWCVDKLYTDIL